MLNLITGIVVVGVTLYCWRKTMAALDDLTREVAELTSTTDSAIALIEGLKTRLDDAIATGDMDEVQALSDSLSTQTDRLAAAVAANTPAETEPGTVEPGTTPVEEGSVIVTPGGTDETGTVVSTPESVDEQGNLRRT